MPRWLPWFLLLILPCLRFPGALPGSDVVSADDHLSVHHVFQESAGGRVRHPQLSDPALQFAALRGRVVQALQHTQVPLWNPDIWAGAPLMGDGQSSVGSPVTWLRLLLPEDLAQDTGVMWVMLWTGLGTALLTQRMGAGSWGACAAGAAAMTGPYTQVWLLHPHAATFAWLPWVLLALDSRRTAALALATAGMLMGGHPETAAHSLVFVCLWAIVRNRWRSAAIGLPLGGLLAAPVLLPLAEEVLRSASLASHGGNRLQWSQLLDLVWPGWHGHPALETWAGSVGTWSDGRLHPGLGILGLAALGLWRAPRRMRGLWLAWALCILVSCIGLPGPANHARLGAMGAWFLALAGGLTLSQLRPRWRPIATLVVIATGIWACWHDQGAIPAKDHAPAPAAWTQALRAELGCTSESAGQGGCGRVLGLGWAIQPNTGALAGLPDIRGYDLPVSWETERLQRTLRTHPVRPWFQVDTLPPLDLLRFMGVRAVASPDALEGLQKIDIGTAPLNVYRVPGDAPRAWLATAPMRAPDPDRAGSMLQAGADRAAPPVVDLPGTWPTQGRMHPAEILQEGLNAVTVRVDAPKAGVLVLADAWHPGWTATDQDGERKKVLQVGGIFRGVILTPGLHTVRFTYEPIGWSWGLRLGGIGAALLCLLVIRRRQRTA